MHARPSRCLPSGRLAIWSLLVATLLTVPCAPAQGTPDPEPPPAAPDPKGDGKGDDGKAAANADEDADAGAAPGPLRRTKHARELRSLIAALGDDDWATREAARDRLIELGHEAEPYLRRAVRDPDPERSAAAEELLQTLRWLVPEGLRAVVGKALDDFPALPAGERAAALAQLAQRGHEMVAAVPFLINVARFDPDAGVRRTAVAVYLGVTRDGAPHTDPVALEALADEAPSAEVALLRARLLRRLADLPKAVAAVEQAVKLGARDRETLAFAIDLYLDAKLAEKALPLALRVETLLPADPLARIQAGEALVLSGDEEQGLAKLESVLELPEVEENLQVLLRLGQAYLRAGQAERAVGVHRRALGRFPFSRELNVSLADVLLAQGQRAEAVDVLLSEIRYTSPGGAAFAAIRARLEQVLADSGAAWLNGEDPFFLDAYRGRPVVDARTAVAGWLAARGLREEAAQELRAVCALAPRSASARVQLGDVLRDAGDLSGARAAYREAASLEPEAALPEARLRALDGLEARLRQAGGDGSASEAAEGLSAWDQRIERANLSGGVEAVSTLAPPPLVLPELVVVSAAGLVDLFGLSAQDGTLLWRFVPDPPPREEGVLAEQIGLEPVALVAVSPGTVAAFSPARARDPRPVIAALYNVYWRPVHRSWRRAQFRELRAYFVDPQRGERLGEVSLEGVSQVLPPAPVGRRGRVLAYVGQGRRRDLCLIDLVQGRALWRSEAPPGARRPRFADERVLVSWPRGVSARAADGQELWTYARPGGEEPAADLSTGLALLADAVAVGAEDGRTLRLDLTTGAAEELARPSERRLTSITSGEGRIFAAERGGPVHAITPGEAAVATWAESLGRAAHRELLWAGGRLFAINGDVDYFDDETPLLLALDPASGEVLLQRPIARPAVMVRGEVEDEAALERTQLVVVVAGGVGAPGGLRVLGVRPQVSLDARATNLVELRTAAADALAEGRFEVAAIVARKYLRTAGGSEVLGDDDLAFLVRVLTRSRRPDEAKDLLHLAEERAVLARTSGERWEALATELGLLDAPPASADEPAGPEEGKADEQDGQDDEGGPKGAGAPPPPPSPPTPPPATPPLADPQ